MQPATYLAFDLGAESGRAVLGELRSGTLTVREIHRFANEPVAYGDALHWDVARLWHEMRAGLGALRDTTLAGIGVDTWGVDYALLGEQLELLQNPYHYRDKRNVAAMADVLGRIPKDDIYAVTGIQFLHINTINQLAAARRLTPRLLSAADRFVMMPDLFNLWLTGRAVSEFTNATTTQLVDAKARTWAAPLMTRLDLPAHIAPPMVEAGSIVGPLLPRVSPPGPLAGTPVVASASHDTASAVAAITARDGTAFISSGTWSLVGTELDAPVLTPDAMRLNFSNEGGVGGTTRLLKNVMGLWMLQSCRRHWLENGREFDYAELTTAAAECDGLRHLVDPDEASFAAPDSMPDAIDRFCARTGQPAPATPGEYARAILDSLALKYRLVLGDLETVTGRPIRQIRVIGGGSKNRVLNQFTADATGRRVIAGPAEATALGNIGVQLIATGRAASLAEARAAIDRSFPTEVFEPRDPDPWNREFARFQQYCELAYA
ncbi:MAG: rhamnulokinase [Acidobacteria bacterium]|nr:MAG: rhamnulokinase [Acidobacteriota bacterium]